MFPLYQWVPNGHPFAASLHTHTHTHSIFQLRSTRIPGLPWHSFGVVDGLGVIDLQEISSAPPDHKKAICPNPPIENGVPLKSPIIDLCLHHFHIGVSSYSLSFDGQKIGKYTVQYPIFSHTPKYPKSV